MATQQIGHWLGVGLAAVLLGVPILVSCGMPQDGRPEVGQSVTVTRSSARSVSTSTPRRSIPAVVTRSNATPCYVSPIVVSTRVRSTETEMTQVASSGPGSPISAGIVPVTGSTVCPTPSIIASATGSLPVNRSFYTLALDGVDITSRAEYVHRTTAPSNARFTYVPEVPLSLGQHEVSFSYSDETGARGTHTSSFKVEDVSCQPPPC